MARKSKKQQNEKWFQKTAIQGAIVSGIFLVVVAIIGSIKGCNTKTPTAVNKPAEVHQTINGNNGTQIGTVGSGSIVNINNNNADKDSTKDKHE